MHSPRDIEDIIHRASARGLIDFFQKDSRATHLDAYNVGDVLLTTHGTEAISAACSFMDRFPKARISWLGDVNEVFRMFRDLDFHPFQRLLMAKRIHHLQAERANPSIHRKLVADLDSGDLAKQTMAAVALRGNRESDVILQYRRMVNLKAGDEDPLHGAQALLAFIALDNIRDSSTGQLHVAVEGILKSVEADTSLQPAARHTARRILVCTSPQPLEEFVIRQIKESLVEAGRSQDVLLPRTPDAQQIQIANKNASRMIELFGADAFFAGSKLVDTFRGPLDEAGVRFLSDYIFDQSFSFMNRALSAVRLRETPEAEDLLIEKLKSEDPETAVIAFLALWEGNLVSLQGPLLDIITDETAPTHSRQLAIGVISRAERQADYDVVRAAASSQGDEAVEFYSRVFTWCDWEPDASEIVAVTWNEQHKLPWELP